jgi:prolyl oligopeptidase PreP (S9A serine peptidase family)
MVARMQHAGIPDVFLYEAREGGHSGTSDPRDEAKKAALVFRFFGEYLGR